MQPGTAAATTRLLDRLDERVRRTLKVGPARQLLPKVTCPACRRRLVYVQTAAPLDEQTVICAADCRCTGVGGDGPGVCVGRRTGSRAWRTSGSGATYSARSRGRTNPTRLTEGERHARDPDRLHQHRQQRRQAHPEGVGGLPAAHTPRDRRHRPGGPRIVVLRSGVEWQNACWCAEIRTERIAILKDKLRLLAREFRQDSIAWAVAPTTEFLGATS
ncbi:hypothetical protein NKG94_34580 [Micromonospora sp. M12]